MHLPSIDIISELSKIRSRPIKSPPSQLLRRPIPKLTALRRNRRKLILQILKLRTSIHQNPIVNPYSPQENQQNHKLTKTRDQGSQGNTCLRLMAVI